MSDSTTFPVWLIPALPFAGAFLNLVFGRNLPRRMVHFIAVGTVAAACVVAAFAVAGPLWADFAVSGDPEPVSSTVWTWIAAGKLEIDLTFVIDTLSAVMILVVTFVGTLIHIYSMGYMAHEPRYATYFGYLNLFMGSMLVLVLGDSLPVMFIGWEGVGLCSYLLIGFWFTEEQNAYAGRKAFIVNRIGDFAFILGICLLFWATGSASLSPPGSDELLVKSFIGGERLAAAAGILLFIGACGKSAQIPLYIWLPDAMAGPTPVSALIHAATMVTAGVYMVARMSWLFSSSTTAQFVVATVGALTALLAAIIAFAQTDLKKVLAYSTISQLGFMFVGVGTGAYVAGIFHLVTHAFFKAGLFLGAGSVMHAMSGSGDIRKMGGLRGKLPWTHGTFLLFCLAIAGFPLLSGFFSKDEILGGAWAVHPAGWPPVWGKVLWGILMVAALGTAFYMFRLYFLVFAGKCRADAETQDHIHESPTSMTMPLVVLAAGAVVLGVIGLPHVGGLPNVLASWLKPAFTHSGFEVAEVHLGGGTIIGLMAAATAIGLIGIGAAWLVYGKGTFDKADALVGSGLGAWVRKVAENKFYVDELYDLIIVRPLWWVGRTVFEVIDRFLIDLIIVNGAAFIVDSFGRVARWVQNGQVQRYLTALIVGSALVLFVASRPEGSIRYEVVSGRTVSFTADLGEGPSAEGAKLAWDFDGDGQTDSAKPSVLWTFPGTGPAQVELHVTYGVFHREVTVHRTIEFAAGGAQ